MIATIAERFSSDGKAGFHMITAIATIAAITLSDPYDYKFPYDRYDRYRVKKKITERTWNKQRLTAF